MPVSEDDVAGVLPVIQDDTPPIEATGGDTEGAGILGIREENTTSSEAVVPVAEFPDSKNETGLNEEFPGNQNLGSEGLDAGKNVSASPEIPPSSNSNIEEADEESRPIAAVRPEEMTTALFEDERLLVPSEKLLEGSVEDPQINTIQASIITTDSNATSVETLDTGLIYRLFGGQFSGLKITAWVVLGIWIALVVFLASAKKWHWTIPCTHIRSELMPTKAPAPDHDTVVQTQTPIQSAAPEPTLSAGAAVCDTEADARRLDEVMGAFTQEVILAATPQEVARLVGKDPARRPRNVHMLSEWKPRLP